MRHVKWSLRDKHICRRCGREASTQEAKASLRNSPCLGSSVGRVLARANLDAQAMQRRCAIGYYALWDMGARPLDPQEDPPPEHRDNAIGDPAHDSGDLQTDESDMECDDLGSLAGSPPPFGDEEVAQHPDMAEAASMEDEEDVFGHGGGLDQSGDESAGAEKRRRLRSGPAAASSSSALAWAPPRQEASAAAGRKRRRPNDGEGEGCDERGTTRRRARESGVTAPAVSATPLGAPSGRVSGGWGHGHKVAVLGPAAWCRECGHYALKRVGRGLAAACPGRAAADAAAARRVQRLSEGRHPITGRRLC